MAAGNMPAAAAIPRANDAIRRIATTCDMCFWKCGAIAYLRNDKLWKVEGNPLDPLSRGRLCPRGTGGVGAHYDQNRLRRPLMRQQKRGQEEWVEVTWDEALGYIAERMLKIKAEYGPEAMALFSHGIGGNFFKHTMKAFGTPNLAAPSYAQCRGPRDVGFELTFGEGSARRSARGTYRAAKTRMRRWPAGSSTPSWCRAFRRRCTNAVTLYRRATA